MVESTGKQDYEDSLTFRPLRKGKNQCAYIGTRRSKKPGIQCPNFTDAKYCYAHCPHKHDKRKMKTLDKRKDKERLKSFRLAKKFIQAPDFVRKSIELQTEILVKIQEVCTENTIGFANQAAIRELAEKGKNDYIELIATLSKRISAGNHFNTNDPAWNK